MSILAVSRKDEVPIFEDVSFEAISVVSSDRKALTVDGAVQTDDVVYSEVGTDMVKKCDAETQSIRIEEEKEQASTLPDEFASCLKLVEDELSRECVALEEYEPLPSLDSERQIKYKYALTCPQIIKSQSTSPLQCVGLSWNATGKTICAVYGRRDITGWCEDVGYLCAWNVFQKDFHPEKPITTIEHSSCLMMISCHPERPALVAAGSFYGEILIYDLSKAQGEEPLIASSEINDYFHREPISGLDWIPHTDKDKHQLLSTSADGKILFWSLDAIRTKDDIPILPHPVSGMLVTRPDTKTGLKSKHIIVGATALALPQNQRVGKGGPLSLLVGSEAGRIFRCALANPPNLSQLTTKVKSKHTSLPWDKVALELLARAPAAAQSKLAKHVESTANNKSTIRADDIFASKPKVQMIFPAPQGSSTAFHQHVGPVTQLSASPFHRNLFASVSTDGNFKIFSTLHTKPIFKIAPFQRDFATDHNASLLFSSLYTADWSKVRPLVIAVAGDNAKVRIYDIGNETPDLPVTELSFPVPKEPVDPDYADRCSKALCLQFNPRQRDFLACADAGGRIHVWQLSWHLSNTQKNESDILDSIVDRFMKEDGARDEDDVKEIGDPPLPK